MPLRIEESPLPSLYQREGHDLICRYVAAVISHRGQRTKKRRQSIVDAPSLVLLRKALGT